MTRFRRALAFGVVLAGLTALAPTQCVAGDDQFSFYGLQFGMVKTETVRHLPNTDGSAKSPGHGMTDVELVFDREDLLMEIRASWPRPEDPLQQQGLLRALREKFVTPVAAKFPAVTVTLDEYSNRAAVRVIFLSAGIREKNIEFHKNAYLKSIQ